MPCSLGGRAALRRRGKPYGDLPRRRALLYPQWRYHIRDRIYVFEYLVVSSVANFVGNSDVNLVAV